MFLGQITPVKSEYVELARANRRVIYEDIRSPMDLPRLARSTRDGFAVSFPGDEILTGSRFSIVGDIPIGVVPKISLKGGQAVRIATGSYAPKGTCSVLMKEYAKVEGDSLVCDRSLRRNENVLKPGEDIARRKTILHKGSVLLPTHIALLAMLGQARVKVYRKPRIAFFSTGDELMDLQASSSQSKQGPRIYDANRPFIASMLEILGAETKDLGIAKDNFGSIRSKMLLGLKRFDGLILSAGSSVGERDFVAKAEESINGVRVLVHGVAMRPSSPTGLATYRGRPFISLPGFPTSAIVSFLVFARPAISKLAGKEILEDYPIVQAKLLDEYAGKIGIRHFLRVKLTRDESSGEYVARIVRPSEAQFSGWLSEANGLAIIGEQRGSVRINDKVPILVFGSIPLDQDLFGSVKFRLD
jgi:molybdopterin molybdotransferase